MTRVARCAYFSSCGSEAPSDPTTQAFFEDLSDPAKLTGCAHPGSNALGQCGYAEAAHALAKDPARAYLRGIRTHDFVAPTEGQPFDRFYCGCRGWD